MKSPLLLVLVFAIFRQLPAAETNGVVEPPFVTPTAGGLKPNSSTGVTFQTSAPKLQHLFDTGEKMEVANVHQFTPTMKVLVEGGGYNNAWIETQPMGGEMYAKRNPEVALNNQLVFMITQRADGRLPGAVKGDQKLGTRFGQLQGYCFPDPAWKMYFWAGKDRDYLQKLYGVLEAYDAYLWRTRDSNKDGLLETWCVTDTGEDGSTRLTSRFAPWGWRYEFPPSDPRAPDPHDPANFQRFWGGAKDVTPPTRDQILVPIASMDIMAYSYEGRATLAKISRELGNGREDFWKQQAEEVRQRVIKGLWNPERHACFDRDRYGKVLPELVHNNLRAMHHGMFTQEMADAFIRYHLLNPDEFWTPMPLPSIAIKEPLYRAGPNDWSGQPEGLTFQRAIRALQNYGHFAEVTLIGRKLIDAIIRGGHFPQQFDPMTGLPDVSGGGHGDGYGPTVLAVLEYCSLMNGISLDVEHNQVWWSGLADGGENYTYTQRWNDQTWTLTKKGGTFTACVNNRDVFSCTAGVRVVTELDGRVREVVGIDTAPQSVTLNAGNTQSKLTVAPNQIYRADGTVLRIAPFDYPYHER
jgi:hypothetical protein